MASLDDVFLHAVHGRMGMMVNINFLVLPKPTNHGGVLSLKAMNFACTLQNWGK